MAKRARSPSSSRSPPAKRHHLSPIRFLIISDTHSASLPSHPKCDVLLHCGDLTEDGTPESISAAIQSMRAIDAELKLVIAGNHDIALDKDFWLSQGGEEANNLKAVDTVFGREAKEAGVTFLKEGTHKFTLKSGASFRVYASPYTPEHGISAFQYPTAEDRYNSPTETPTWGKNVSSETSIIPCGVDIVMTHGPPKYILDNTNDGSSAGCEHLRRAIARVQPKLHCFGHIHGGYGAQRLEFNPPAKNVAKGAEDNINALPKEWVGKNQAKKKGFASISPGAAETFKEGKQTLVVNAAIMDCNNLPPNMPWVVDLDLPSSKE